MSLRTTLLAAFAYALLVVIVMLEVPLVLNVARRVDAEIKAESSGQAQLVATSAGDRLPNREAVQRLADRSARALGGRVIVVGPRGRMVADSAGPGLRGVSYADRPEVARALNGETAQGTRQSESLGEEILFTAAPILRDGRPVGAVRVTQSVEEVNDEVRNDALALIGIGAAALALGLAVAWILAAYLSRPMGTLAETARRVADGDLDARAPVRGSREQRDVAAAFNEMTARLSSVLEAQREFVANASHQLRTPLTGLRLRIEAAADRASEPAVREDLVAAEAEVERLAGLLGDLLTLAKEGQDAPAPVDLGTAARRAAERWEADAAGRGGRLIAKGEAAAVVLATPEDIGIVLDNLAENAILYSPRGGSVAIEWGADERHGWVAVIDEGPGLAPGEEEKVLKRFARGTASTGVTGSGLGLAIVASLAERWGGTLSLRNRDGGGLRAEVRIPLAEADVATRSPQ